jgi:hypothetical protein
MVQQPLICDDYYVPDANRLVTEDDTPVDNFASEKQQRLLVGSLYSSWQEQTFLAAANVGVFLSFDVQVPENWWEKQNRSYLVWRFGKPQQAEQERLEKEQAQHRAEQAEQRAQLLAEQLRSLGIDPDTLS